MADTARRWMFARLPVQASRFPSINILPNAVRTVVFTQAINSSRESKRPLLVTVSFGASGATALHFNLTPAALIPKSILQTSLTKTNNTMKVLIVYHSPYGHTLQLARAIEEGVKSVSGVEAVFRRAPEFPHTEKE